MKGAIEGAVNLLNVVPEDATKGEVVSAMTEAAEQGSYTVGPEYDAVREKIKEFEGWRPHVYLDGEGYPTQGWGHKLSDETYSSESSAAFRRDWGDEPAWSKEFANTYFEIDLQREYSRLRKTYATMKGGVERNELEFDQLPLEAREVLLDTAFNMGGGFGKKFPSMIEALQNGDFHHAGLELMYRKGGRILGIGTNQEGRKFSQYSDYYIGNNGPDRFHDSGRKIFLDQEGGRYSERSETVALNNRGEIVNPRSTSESYQWFNLPTVNPSTGYYFGVKWKNGEKIDRRVYPMNFGRTPNVDIDQALEFAQDKSILIGPFDSVDEAIFSARERSSKLAAESTEETAKSYPNSRANYNVSRLMFAKLPEHLEYGNFANPEYQKKYAAEQLQQSLLEETK